MATSTTVTDNTGKTFSFEIIFPNSEFNTEEGHFPLIYIKSFSFVEDIDKMYTGAKLILKDVSSYILNSLKLGQEVTFVFKEIVGNLSYKNYMKILAIAPVTENNALLNELEITLISHWYFETFIKTQKHTGSVGSIIRTICSNNQKEKVFPKYDISDTQDTIRIRYQTKEKLQDFMKRIVPFGIIDNEPVYLYSDSKGSLNLKGLSSFQKGTVKYVLIPDSVQRLEDTSLQAIKSNGMIPVRMNSFHTILALQTASSSEKQYFLTENFAGEGYSTVSYYNAESSNTKISSISPPSTRCWNWNYLPQDAFALSVWEYFQKNLGAFSIQCSLIAPTIDYFHLGAKVKVFLPSNSNNINDILTGSSSPSYIITHIERKYSNYQEMTVFTGVLSNRG